MANIQYTVGMFVRAKEDIAPDFVKGDVRQIMYINRWGSEIAFVSVSGLFKVGILTSVEPYNQ